MIALREGWFRRPDLDDWAAVMEADFWDFAYRLSLWLIANAKT